MSVRGGEVRATGEEEEEKHRNLFSLLPLFQKTKKLPKAHLGALRECLSGFVSLSGFGVDLFTEEKKRRRRTKNV